jgi:hypothetical protein
LKWNFIVKWLITFVTWNHRYVFNWKVSSYNTITTASAERISLVTKVLWTAYTDSTINFDKAVNWTCKDDWTSTDSTPCFWTNSTFQMNKIIFLNSNLTSNLIK